jgi:hypothetical protein
MKVKITDTTFDECKELVVIYWNNLDELKVYVLKDNVEINYPYTHKVAFSYLENLEIILDEYPDYISFVENNPEIKAGDFHIKDKNFLAFIDTGLTKIYFSSVPFNMLQSFFSDIKRFVTKGIRVDVP